MLAKIKPNIFSYTKMNRKLDYNAASLVLIVTKVMIWYNPGKRFSGALHGTIIWYIGPAMENYR